MRCWDVSECPGGFIDSGKWRVVDLVAAVLGLCVVGMMDFRCA
jgi:hypothetical protein